MSANINLADPTPGELAADARLAATIKSNPLYERDSLLALANLLAPSGILEIDDKGDTGIFIAVLCPASLARGRTRTWMSIWVLWHTGCRFTNYAQGGLAWDGSHSEAIEFINLALSNHAIERARQPGLA